MPCQCPLNRSITFLRIHGHHGIKKKVFTSNNIEDARVAKLLLDENDIEAEVTNEHTTTIFGSPEPAVEMEVYVRNDEEFTQAREVLEDHFGSLEEPGDQGTPDSAHSTGNLYWAWICVAFVALFVLAVIILRS